MFIKVNRSKIEKNGIVYFNLMRCEKPIPSRIARIDDKESDVAYLDLYTEDISISKGSFSDFFVEPLSKEETTYDIPKGVPIGEIHSFPEKKMIETYIRFKGEILSISNPESPINKYNKDIELRTKYVEILTENDCSFTIRVSLFDYEGDELRVGSIVTGTAATRSFIIKKDLVKWKYYITKDCEDGSLETVLEVEGTEDQARAKFLEIIDEQCQEYHIAKTLKKWRVIRLFDVNGKQLAQES